jgi:chitin disaccharide deacetylase
VRSALAKTVTAAMVACALPLQIHAGQAPAAASASAGIPPRLGYPAGARLLVIHADDLGMAHSVNRATFEALEQGWITASSILVPCPWFPEVARWARTHPTADLGVHLDLNSEWTTFRWRPLSAPADVPSLLDADGYFPLVETAVVARAEAPEVERELRAQIDRAKAAGIPLTHLDSHMAALFQTAPLFAVYRRLGASYGLPLLIERTGARGGAAAPFLADAEGDALVDRVLSLEPGVTAAGWRDAYEKILAPLPPGAYELIVHLAYDDDEMRGATADHPNWGAGWRQNDFDLVRSPEFRDFLKAQGFTLVGWHDLARARRTEGN